MVKEVGAGRYGLMGTSFIFYYGNKIYKYLGSVRIILRLIHEQELFMII